MKTFAAATLAGLIFAGQTSAQEAAPKAPIQQDVVAPQAPKTSNVDTNALGQPRPERVEKPVRKYSGVLAGWKKGDKPQKVFSLRNPADPRRDGENVINDLPTETRRGIKLFSLDF